MSDDKKPMKKELRLRNAGFPTDALSDDFKKRVELLDENELKMLESIKLKLNKDLSDEARRAADTVGGFVW